MTCDIGIRENVHTKLWEVVKYTNPRYARGNGAYAGLMYDFDDAEVVSSHKTRDEARKAAGLM